MHFYFEKQIKLILNFRNSVMKVVIKIYTFVLTNSRSLRTTIPETIYQNDDNLNSFRFLIPSNFNGLNMTSFDVLMKYIACDGEEKYLNLSYDKVLYQGMLSITVPITRKFTYKYGTLKLALGFISKESSEIPPSSCDEFTWSSIMSTNDETEGSGNDTLPQYQDILFSTGYAYIKIQRTENCMNMSAIDRFIQKVNHLEQTVPDNLRAYPDSMEMQLESHGKPIGQKVEVPCRVESEGDSEWSGIKENDGNSDLEWDEI